MEIQQQPGSSTTSPIPSTCSPALDAVWGKLGDGSHGHHSLLAHSLDVMAVAMVMIREVMSAGTRQQLAGKLGISEDDVSSLIAFLAGAHDFGKVTPAFQYRRLSDHLGHYDLLADAGLTDSGTGTAGTPHGNLTTSLLNEALREHGVRPTVAVALAQVSGAHHGLPSAATPVGPHQRGDAAWDAVRREMIEILLALSGAANALRTVSCVDVTSASFMAGVVSSADWVGSNERTFGYTNEALAI